MFCVGSISPMYKNNSGVGVVFLISVGFCYDIRYIIKALLSGIFKLLSIDGQGEDQTEGRKYVLNSHYVVVLVHLKIYY